MADISPAGALNAFRKKYPQRFVNTGVAEQIMIGMAAGMAMEGLKPFAYTIATFALFRPYEFIRCDLAYQNLPVTVVGIGGGVTYSMLGGTHHAMEDVAIACALPNMRVIAPCDPFETKHATEWCTAQESGPVYLRLGKAGEPTLSEAPWRFGKIRELRHGIDSCIIGYGPILSLAIDAAESLEEMGESVAVYSCHTLKPLDVEGLERLLYTFSRIVVLEEAVARGGLGEAILALSQQGVDCNIKCLSLKDEFLHVYGSHADVLAAHELTLERLIEAVNA